jgi:TPP-dependent 2-oxoacid decarboxylase
MDLGYFSAKLDPKRTIHVRKDCTVVSYHTYFGFGLKEFLQEMDKRNIGLSKGLQRDSWPILPQFKLTNPSRGKKLTTNK